MFSRTFLFLAMITAAFGVPIVMTQTNWSNSVRETLATWRPASESDGPAGSKPLTGGPDRIGSAISQWLRAPDGSATQAITAPAADVASTTDRPWPLLGGPPSLNLANVVRFDASPSWLTENWARVSRLPRAGRLQPYRVPLCTGTHPHAVCGAMTYYFDPTGTVQRVTVHGQTQDPQPIIQEVTAQWGLQPDDVLGPLYFTRRNEDRVRSIVTFSQGPIILARSKRQGNRLFIELNQDAAEYPISDQLQQLLAKLAADSASDEPSNSTAPGSASALAGEQ